MSLVDSRTFLANGGYIQKGAEVNVYESDLSKEVQDLLPSRWYRDDKIFQLERRAIFSRCWHIASFMARFQMAGDYLTLEMFGWPFFIIKDKDGNINAFHNICRHRGHPVTVKESGSTTVLACRFHNWSYLPTGSLHKAPQYMNLLNFDPGEHSLFKVHTHVTAQGFIFVSFDSSPTPTVAFANQFGDDFDPHPSPQPAEESVTNTPSCYHHPSGITTISGNHLKRPRTTIGRPSSTASKNAFIGIGQSREFLPPLREDLNLSESYIAWLYPLGSIIFSDNALLIARFDAKGVLDTRYQSETYRRTTMMKPKTEDVELAVAAQKGFNSGVLGKGRLHPKQEYAVVWYQDKVRKTLEVHLELEMKEKKMIDYSIPNDQAAFVDEDKICKMMGPKIEW